MPFFPTVAQDKGRTGEAYWDGVLIFKGELTSALVFVLNHNYPAAKLRIYRDPVEEGQKSEQYPSIGYTTAPRGTGAMTPPPMISGGSVSPVPLPEVKPKKVNPFRLVTNNEKPLEKTES